MCLYSGSRTLLANRQALRHKTTLLVSLNLDNHCPLIAPCHFIFVLALQCLEFGSIFNVLPQRQWSTHTLVSIRKWPITCPQHFIICIFGNLCRFGIVHFLRPLQWVFMVLVLCYQNDILLIRLQTQAVSATHGHGQLTRMISARLNSKTLIAETVFSISLRHMKQLLVVDLSTFLCRSSIFRYPDDLRNIVQQCATLECPWQRFKVNIRSNPIESKLHLFHRKPSAILSCHHSHLERKVTHVYCFLIL